MRSKERRLFPHGGKKFAAAPAVLRRIGKRGAAFYAVFSVLRVARAKDLPDAFDVQFQQRLARHVAHEYRKDAAA